MAERGSGGERPVGYLVSRYPALSHTFVRREVAALRRRGLAIRTFSVRRPEPAERAEPADREEYERTRYLLPVGTGRLLRLHARALRRRPGRYVRTFALALRHRGPGARALLWSLFHFAEAVALAAELEREGVRHLHTHFANAGGTLGLLATRLAGLPWSLTVHGSKAEFEGVPAALLGEKVAAARFVACVSQYGRSQVMRLSSPEDWEKTLVVRCGVEPARLPEPAGAEPGAAPRVLCVGRLVPEKAQIGLVEAFAEAVRAGLPGELRMVGEGPDRARIEARVEALGLGERVRLLGALPESRTLEEIARADVLALASLMEGLPVVLMEALALGVPVVAPAISGIPELVEHERTGLLVPPADWPAVGHALARLLADPALRERLAKEGRARVAADFDVDRAVEPLRERLARGG